MKSIILAAGFGTRLLPLTEEIPKPIFPICNRPIILIQIENLRKAGIKCIGINTHHFPEMIIDLLGDGGKLGVSIEYRHESVLLNTGGGLANFEDYICKQPDFIVHNCDILSDMDLSIPLEFHREMKSIATLVLIDNPPNNSVLIDDKKRVLDIGGKRGIAPGPGSRLLYGAGIFLYSREIFNWLPPSDEHPPLVPSLFRLMEERPNSVNAYVPEDQSYWRDIGSIDSYLEAHHDILTGGKLQLPGIKLSGGKLVGNGCRISPDVRMKGFNCIGSNVEIGKGSCLKNCVVWNGAKINPGSFYTNAIITPKQVAMGRYPLYGGQNAEDGRRNAEDGKQMMDPNSNIQ